MNKNRLETLRSDLAKRNIESLLITDLLNVRYLTGFTGTFAQVVVTPKKAVFITDSRYTDQAAEETKGFTFELLKDGTIQTITRVAKKLKIRQLGIEEHSITYDYWIKIHSALPDIELVTAGNPISAQRLIKTPDEIKKIRNAARIADAGFTHVLSLLKPGAVERGLAIELDSFMRKEGAEKEAFESIIASGPRSALVHGRATDRRIEEGDIVLFDFGAKVNGYHSDISRTVVIGKATAKQKKIYEIVLEAHNKALAAIKPGVTGGAIDEIARYLIEKKGYGNNFGHGLGHGLGLDVHDDRILSKGSETVLKSGMVFTVEPGIYITGWGGIRIEDDILVTRTGAEILTSSERKLIF